MNYKIEYPTPLDEIKDEYNDNIDVCVSIDGKAYTFVVVTLENLKTAHWLNENGYVTPGAPPLIVEKLANETIEALLEELVKDETLLKRYGSDL